MLWHGRTQGNSITFQVRQGQDYQRQLRYLQLLQMQKQIPQVCPHDYYYTEDAFDAEKVTIGKIIQNQMFNKESHAKNPQAKSPNQTSNSKPRARDPMVASHSSSAYWHTCTWASLQKPQCQSHQSWISTVWAILCRMYYICLRSLAWDYQRLWITNCEPLVTHNVNQKIRSDPTRKKSNLWRHFSWYLFCHLKFWIFLKRGDTRRICKKKC